LHPESKDTHCIALHPCRVTLEPPKW
jgi:hypothetical protein